MTMYEWAEKSFDNRSEMLDYLVYQYFTGGGLDPAPDVDFLLAGGETASKHAADCTRGLGLDESPDGVELSHMALNDYTASDLAEAIQRLITLRPDKKQTGYSN
ncbi:hypothetical protein D2T29_12380 [Sinirhodobacter populi]|uniref:Uncharacterized protein n=1 Tax=Paenirhodobacter populi TaxID=2306993 RepID=A0A443KCD1_9RHOB|nr:hypothetical protein [Sinirhodobacter populi]RWR30461.1 hypothetical protein D2T29_12380 [Sinirhodobacter populi]